MIAIDLEEVETVARARRCTACGGMMNVPHTNEGSSESYCYPREGDGRECGGHDRDTPIDERIVDDIELIRRKDHDRQIRDIAYELREIAGTARFGTNDSAPQSPEEAIEKAASKLDELREHLLENHSVDSRERNGESE